MKTLDALLPIPSTVGLGRHVIRHVEAHWINSTRTACVVAEGNRFIVYRFPSADRLEWDCVAVYKASAPAIARAKKLPNKMFDLGKKNA